MKNNLKNSEAYDTLDSLDIDELINMKRKQEYLKMHPYAIWQSKDGKYWYTTLPDKTKERGVRQIRRSSRKELEDAIVEYWSTNSNSMTVGEIFEEWNTYKLDTKKVIQSSFIRMKSVFKGYFTTVKNKPISEMKPIDWCDFLERVIVTENVKKEEFAQIKVIAIGIVKWSYKHDYIDYSSSSVIDLLDISAKSFNTSKKKDSEEVFSEEETPKIINYLCNHTEVFLNLGLLLMFVTGIRAGELMSLRHCDFDGNILKIRRTVTLIQKENGKSGWGIKDSPKSQSGLRDIIVPDEFQWLMDTLSEGNPDDLVFTTREGTLLRHVAVSNALRKVCEDLGIPYRTPHKIRKTYTSMLLDNNVDSRFVMQQVGHSNISTTEGVYHKDRRNVERKVEIINSVFRNSEET